MCCEAKGSKRVEARERRSEAKKRRGVLKEGIQYWKRELSKEEEGERGKVKQRGVYERAVERGREGKSLERERVVTCFDSKNEGVKGKTIDKEGEVDRLDGPLPLHHVLLFVRVAKEVGAVAETSSDDALNETQRERRKRRGQLRSRRCKRDER